MMAATDQEGSDMVHLPVDSARGEFGDIQDLTKWGYNVNN